MSSQRLRRWLCFYTRLGLTVTYFMLKYPQYRVSSIGGAYQLVTFLSCVDELAYSVLSGVEEIPMERLLPMTKWRG